MNAVLLDFLKHGMLGELGLGTEISKVIEYAGMPTSWADRDVGVQMHEAESFYYGDFRVGFKNQVVTDVTVNVHPRWRRAIHWSGCIPSCEQSPEEFREWMVMKKLCFMELEYERARIVMSAHYLTEGNVFISVHSIYSDKVTQDGYYAQSPPYVDTFILMNPSGWLNIPKKYQKIRK